MKKTILLCGLSIMLISSFVQALSWAYPFIAWEGKVYEVKLEEIISKSEIGKIVGEVTTRPDEMTGAYYGDASNYYPKGTKYYEIKGTSPSDAIAVKENNQWVRAVYVHKTPFHIMNVLTHPLFLVTAGITAITAVVMMILFTKRKKPSGT